MEAKTFSMRSLFMPVILSSAITVFLISLVVTNRLFYVPADSYAAGEGAYASATISFIGVPSSGSYFELPGQWGNYRFQVEPTFPGSQNGDYQNGAYIIAGDGADATEIASRTYSLLLSKYNDSSILAEPSLSGTIVTLTETRIGDAYNTGTTYTADSNWSISSFTGGSNPDPDPVLAGADTVVGVYIGDNFGTLVNDTINAQNNSASIAWPMSGGSAGPYIGLADETFDGIYFDIRGSAWDTSAPLLEYSDGFDSWKTLSTSTITTDPSPNPFYVGSTPNISSITFTPPEDWGQNTVAGKTAYYIRFSDMSMAHQGATVQQISLRSYVSNSAPTVSINSVTPYLTGTGDVMVSATVNDTDGDDTSVRLQFWETDCSITMNGNVSSTATGVNSGDLIVSNTSTYQISGISTAISDEFVSFTWLSGTDAPSGDGEYCISLTPYDGTTAGTAATTTVTIDNVAPTQPGNLTVGTTRTTEVTFTLPTSATSSDSNFSQYKIHYTTGTTAGVSDTAHDGTFGDTDLADASFNSTESTTITGLTAGTTYRANIFAYDSYGNSTGAANQVVFTTKVGATAASFSTSSGSTDFSAVEDITAVANAKVANSNGSIQWTNTVDAEGADLDANIVIGDGFVSVDANDLDSTFDAPATVVMMVNDCNDYEIYYASNFYTTKAEIIANGQICNANTTPACTVVSCSAGIVTFTVPHFDGFGVQPVADGGGSGGQIARNYTKPSVYVFNINGGVSATTNRSVQINFGVSDAQKMAVSNNPDFDAVAYGPYAESLNWTLTSEPGEKTVYARFLSPAGIMTQAQRTIIYDPTGEVIPEPVEESGENIQNPEITNNTDVEQVVSDNPNACPLQEEKSYKSGVREPVYYVTETCTRKRIKSSQVFFSYFDSFSAIHMVDAAVLERIPMDEVSVLPYGPRSIVSEGALIKTITTPQVYFIENGMRHLIMSENAFNKRGFLWGAITDVVQTVIDRFEDGSTIE